MTIPSSADSRCVTSELIILLPYYPLLRNNDMATNLKGSLQVTIVIVFRM